MLGGNICSKRTSTSTTDLELPLNVLSIDTEGSDQAILLRIVLRILLRILRGNQNQNMGCPFDVIIAEQASSSMMLEFGYSRFFVAGLNTVYT
jgi:hypothetical protein